MDEKGIINHIENVTTADMARAVQKLLYSEFLSSYQNQASKLHANQGSQHNDHEPSAPSMYLQVQDNIKKQLANDLEECGIELQRFNMEKAVILNKEISSKLAEQAIATAETNTQEAIIDQKTRIAIANANQIAETLNIKSHQENEQKKLSAEADLQSAKIRGNAIIIEAQSKQEARKIEADTERKISLMQTEVEKVRIDEIGKAYANNPAALQLEIKKIEMEGFSKMSFVTPPTAGFGLFDTFRPRQDQMVNTAMTKINSPSSN